MKSILRMIGIVLLFTLILSSQANSTNIFVWEKDNNLRPPDPVLRTSHDATAAITRTLTNEDVDFDTDSELPNDLNDYDVVIVALSFFCPG